MPFPVSCSSRRVLPYCITIDHVRENFRTLLEPAGYQIGEVVGGTFELKLTAARAGRKGWVGTVSLEHSGAESSLIIHANIWPYVLTLSSIFAVISIGLLALNRLAPLGTVLLSGWLLVLTQKYGAVWWEIRSAIRDVTLDHLNV